MPAFFHGTGLTDAQQMAANPGQIDITRGGGEFGRGFYTQHAERHALAWAIRCQARLNGAPCVLKLIVDNAIFGTLTVTYLDTISGPALTAYLQNAGQEYAYIAGQCDLLEGPIMGNAGRIQQKFESLNAQTVLNGNQTTRVVI